MAEWTEVSVALPDGVYPEFDGAIKRSERVLVWVSTNGFKPCAAFATLIHYIKADWEPAWSIEGWNGDFRPSHWMPISDPTL